MRYTGIKVKFSDGTTMPTGVDLDSDEQHPVALMAAMVIGKAASYQRLKPDVVPVAVAASVGSAGYVLRRTATGADVSVATATVAKDHEPDPEPEPEVKEKPAPKAKPDPKPKPAPKPKAKKAKRKTAKK